LGLGTKTCRKVGGRDQTKLREEKRKDSSFLMGKKKKFKQQIFPRETGSNWCDGKEKAAAGKHDRKDQLKLEAEQPILAVYIPPGGGEEMGLAFESDSVARGAQEKCSSSHQTVGSRDETLASLRDRHHLGEESRCSGFKEGPGAKWGGSQGVCRTLMHLKKKSQDVFKGKGLSEETGKRATHVNIPTGLEGSDE